MSDTNADAMPVETYSKTCLEEVDELCLHDVAVLVCEKATLLEQKVQLGNGLGLRGWMQGGNRNELEVLIICHVS